MAATVYTPDVNTRKTFGLNHIIPKECGDCNYHHDVMYSWQYGTQLHLVVATISANETSAYKRNGRQFFRQTNSI